jgi:serine/threonine-protein kinase
MADDIMDRLNTALEGRYEVERELGAGGMATVYLANDLRHERKVALKVLKPELAAVVGAERFLAEIKTTANLQHPHILPLHDSGEADTFLYYVMPYVDGESLRDRLDRERQLPVEEAVRMATDLAEALDYAHRQGVIHRDIKPANIMMHEGRPLIADFGIALAVGAAGGARLTETGLSVGTPYYMSPEQATGDSMVAPQSDIYSLACVLFESLVGEPPYPGATAQAVLGKIIAGKPVSATEIRATIPLHVDAAIRRSLEKLPADRFGTAGEFAKALNDPAFRHGAAAGAGAQSVGSGWNRMTAGFAGLSAVLAVGLGWALSRPPPPEPPAQVGRFSLAVGQGRVPNPHFTVSPDGKALVFQGASPNGAVQLYLRTWDNLDPTPIPGTEGQPLYPTIAPNGQELAFIYLGDVVVAPLRGGVARTVAEAAACCMRWGPDGYVYFSANDRTIRRVPASGGPTEPVTNREPEGDGPHGDFQVTPSGNTAVFTVWGSTVRVEAMRMDTGERKILTQGIKPYLSPEGYLTFVSGDGQLLATTFDEETMELTRPPVPLFSGVVVSGNAYPYYSVSETGMLAYWAGAGAVGNSEPVWVSREGVPVPIDPGWVGGFFTPAVSPDGGRLAIAISGAQNRDLWIKQLDQGPLDRLTFTEGQDHRPWWTPDGNSLVFITERGESRDAYRLRADGVGQAELVLDLDGAINQAFFSPDGEWLVYRTGRLDALDIYARRVQGDTATVSLLARPDVNEHSPALSPDGRWLAYVSDESGRWEVYVRPFPDIDAGRWLVSVDGGSEPIWSNSGRALGYYSYAYQPQYDVSADDERFVMIRMSTGGDANQFIVVQNWFQELGEQLGN